MLGLKLPTDPRWVNIVEKNIHEILTDHAFCEQKAASTAISLMVRYPEESELVEAMIALAQEELSHFEMVHQLLVFYDGGYFTRKIQIGEISTIQLNESGYILLIGI